MASNITRVTVGYTPEQFQTLHSRAVESGFSSIAPYVRRVSLGLPVKVYHRNGSFDAFVGESIRLRKELHLMIDQWELAGHPAEPVLDILNKIDQNTTKIYELCMSKYTTADESAGS